VDSLDQTKSFQGSSYIELKDPEKGQEGYPRLIVENRAYSSRVFRKLHMELAHRQDGMQVTFPDAKHLARKQSMSEHT